MLIFKQGYRWDRWTDFYRAAWNANVV